jgi:hypothetical protein
MVCLDRKEPKCVPRLGSDEFFAAGGTVEELEQLAQDEFQEPVTVDELLLDRALERAELPVKTTLAQLS